MRWQSPMPPLRLEMHRVTRVCWGVVCGASVAAQGLVPDLWM